MTATALSRASSILEATPKQGPRMFGERDKNLPARPRDLSS